MSDGDAEEQIVHKDSNGNILQAGDTVVLIKDLDVNGCRVYREDSTAVRGILLVENNGARLKGRSMVSRS